jgi:hypothetical protein
MILAALTAGVWPLLVSIPRIVAPYADGVFGLNVAIISVLVFLISLGVVCFTSLVQGVHDVAPAGLSLGLDSRSPPS